MCCSHMTLKGAWTLHTDINCCYVHIPSLQTMVKKKKEEEKEEVVFVMQEAELLD